MSKISIKTDFKNGEKLYDTELNNNFGVIQEAFNNTTNQYEEIVGDVKARKWQGATNEDVTYYKGTTGEVGARPKIQGQMLYDTATGESYLDISDSKRINTGSGNVVAVSEEKPTNSATKLWIDPKKLVKADTNNTDSGNANNNVYSTEEVVVGTWMGKPLYRKVIEVPLVDDTPNGSECTVSIDFSEDGPNVIPNIENIQNIQGYMHMFSIKIPLPLYNFSNNDMQRVHVSIMGPMITIVGSDNYFSSSESTDPVETQLIVEYTKTTD